MRSVAIFITAGAAVLAGATPGYGQSDPPRVAVSAEVGVGSASPNTGVVAGGSLLLDVTNIVSIEGQGAFIDRGTGAHAVTASAGVLVNLRSSREELVPFLSAGGGLYHSSFDLSRPRFLGMPTAQLPAGTAVCPMSGTGAGFGQGPGHMYGPGDGTCTGTAGYWGVGQLPPFFARRLGPLTVPPGNDWGRRSFTDPAVYAGVGLRVNASDHVLMRLDARALVALRNRHSYTLGVFTVQVGYRF